MKTLAPERNTFDAIMVDVTHKCNMECANCYLPNRDIPDMDKNKLFDFCKRLSNKTFIRLIGAEPTMREDLFEIISTINKMGHHVSLTTNGLKLGREEFVVKLKKAGLRLVLLSMNGADDDNIYKKIDNGKYSNLKVRALNNLVAHNFIVNTGTIVARNLNEHTISKQFNLINKYRMRVKPVVRLRTIAPLGRYLGDEFTYNFDEFVDVVCNQLNITRDYIEKNQTEAKNNGHGLIFNHENCIIRLVDWSVDDDGVPDSHSETRGRITQDFKIAPFFNHVKENEFGY